MGSKPITNKASSACKINMSLVSGQADMANSKESKNIPLNAESPMRMTDGPGDKDKKVKKAGVGETPGFQEVKNRFKGKYTVTQKKNKVNEYTLRSKSGHSVTYKPGKKVKDTSITAKEAVKREFNKK